jgi:hypothetical protein
MDKKGIKYVQGGFSYQKILHPTVSSAGPDLYNLPAVRLCRGSNPGII